jgi:hypothetical protein
MKTLLVLSVPIAVLLIVPSCSEDGKLGVAGDDGTGGQGANANIDGSADGWPGDACADPCGSVCCTSGQICLTVAGVDQCRGDFGPCSTSAECQNDSTCDPALSRCIGYGPGEKDDACTLAREPGVFRVQLKCAWTGPPAGDPLPSSTHVYVMPLVANFGFGRPSIVFVTVDAVRVIDGGTCAHQITIDQPAPYSDSTPALGDLDGDGRPEIVIRTAAGGVAAFSIDPLTSSWKLLWHTTTPSVTKVQSISIADLDDDGKPEVIVGSRVYSATGVFLDAVAAGDELLCYGSGYVGATVIADVDHDGRLELVFAKGIYELNPATKKLVAEPYFTAQGGNGFVGIGDFGDFPGAAGDQPNGPEIAVMSPGALRLQSVGGDVVFGPVTLPGGGDGGNVTVADYDGDGVPEIGIAGLTQYVVYDPRCGDATRPGVCASNTTNGILWQRAIDENSCAIMGSTVFDFEGDGSAEVVYADECYLRIMSGHDGRTLWSHPRPSGTWYEAPVVAGVDGDGIADLVSPIAYTAPGCPAVDPSFAGLPCSDKAACPSAALSCDAALCRCQADADCGDPDFVCTTPLATSGGTGNVCRSRFADGTGIRVYSDESWAPSRPIWNQHAYAITNVNTDGTIPKSSATQRNWETPGLNNFRQNVQDALGTDPALDLTVKGTGYGTDCSEDNPALALHAEVCNRGTLQLGKTVDVVFYDGDPNAGASVVCQTTVSPPLLPGACTAVECTWNGPPIGQDLTLTIVVDAGGAAKECLETNNRSTLAARCPPPPVVAQ